MSLWLARHARPLVESGICYGALDLDADPAHTQSAAQALARALPQGTPVRVSPLRRCRQLAEALQALRPDLAWHSDARLREMDFGHWEGVSWSEIPKEAVDAWTADFASHRFGGRESAGEVLERVAAAWDEAPKGATTLWIAHAGVAQAATLLAQGRRTLHAASDWPVVRLAYGEWLELPEQGG